MVIKSYITCLPLAIVIGILFPSSRDTRNKVFFFIIGIYLCGSSESTPKNIHILLWAFLGDSEEAEKSKKKSKVRIGFIFILVGWKETPGAINKKAMGMYT